MSQHVTYRELYDRVCKLANALKSLGVQKGDRVTIYLPMIPEAAVAMLACARIGAIHSVVFGGFSPDSLAGRIADCASTVVITADEGLRGGKKVPLKANVDQALTAPGTETVKTCWWCSAPVRASPCTHRDRWYDEVVSAAERTNASPSPSLPKTRYSSSTPRDPPASRKACSTPLVATSSLPRYTHEAVFDLREDDVYWCTADVGWVTGHSYMVYGPLANGATSVMFEGVPSYPGPDRFWQVCDKHRVTIFYTAPTASRA